MNRRLFQATMGACGRVFSALSPSGRSPFPIVVNCVVTWDCNIVCDFCFAMPGRRRDAAASISASAWAEIFRQVPRTAILGFSGGEVFAHPEFASILRAAVKRHRCAVVTNGVGYHDNEKIDLLASVGARTGWSRGLVQVGLSINEDIGDDAKAREVLEEKLALAERIAAARRQFRRTGPAIEIKVLIRDDTAPYLEFFARSVRHPSVDSVTFQMMSNQLFMAFLALDPADGYRVDKLHAARDMPPRPVSFSQHDALRRSLSRIEDLPDSMRSRIGFLPNLSERDYVEHYTGAWNPTRVRCTQPWLHMMIDARGVAFQCINPHGVDLTKVPFAEVWNHPRWREFRRDLREKDVFSRCAGCCFLHQAPAAAEADRREVAKVGKFPIAGYAAAPGPVGDEAT